MIPWFTISFLILAGMFKAVADTLADHFGISIFRNMDPKFWDKSISWKYAKYFPLTKYKIDGWHLANSLSILSFGLAVVFHKPLIQWYFELAIVGATFTLSFNLFYNKILR